MAIRNADDIQLFLVLESFTKTQNITSAFIVDKNSKIILHSNISQNSDTYTGPTDKPALKKTSSSSFVYILPIEDGNALVVNISAQKALTKLAPQKTLYIIMSLIIAFIMSLIINIMLKRFIEKPYQKLKSSISGSGETSTNSDENFTDLIEKQKLKSSKIIDALNAKNENLNSIAASLADIIGQPKQEFIVLDSFNNVISAKDKDGIVSKNIEPGKNIIEQSFNQAIISAVASANEKPNTDIALDINGTAITVSTIIHQNTSLTIISA
jgi:hypothetical protein